MQIKVISYSGGKSKLHKAATIEQAAKIKNGNVWIDLNSPAKKDLTELGKTFGFHHLAVEDSLNEIERPKVEDYDEHMFIIARAIDRKAGDVASRQLSMFVGKDYIITIHKHDIPGLDAVMKEVLKEKHRLVSQSPDYLAYEIIDELVDNYFKMLDEMGERIEKIEHEVIKNPHKNTLEKIFKLKKELLMIRKPLWPTRDVLHQLHGGKLPHVQDKTRIYYRDLYDSTIQVIDLLETYRELVSGTLETHLSSVSNSLNEIMKVLTIISALILIPTWISGIYGMNFKNMPELGWTNGYYFALTLMAISMVCMGAYFRKRRWL